jgi:aspartyl protease family protein
MRKILFSVLTIILSLLFVDCNGCSRSGRNNSRNSKQRINQTSSETRHVKTMVLMSEDNGVYKIPVEINGSDMNFIFDTGASDITISEVEAMFLYRQGKLLKEDILGSQQYQIADGSIAEGTIINLRTVKVGGRTLNNVKASIVHNMDAPLLLGQSALAQFGKVSIDYKRNEISFE